MLVARRAEEPGALGCIQSQLIGSEGTAGSLPPAVPTDLPLGDRGRAFTQLLGEHGQSRGKGWWAGSEVTWCPHGPGTSKDPAAARSWSDTGGTRGPLDICRPEATDEVLVT